MLMTGYERAKYEKAKAEAREEDRTNLINLFREENKTDEEINERLIKLGFDSIPT